MKTSNIHTLNGIDFSEHNALWPVFKAGIVPLCIYAGNYRQAIQFWEDIEQPSRKHADVHYLDDLNRILGIEMCIIVRYGTYYERSDWLYCFEHEDDSGMVHWHYPEQDKLQYIERKMNFRLVQHGLVLERDLS